jgi:hypothetical protein
MKMTVHAALAELKKLDQRINRAIRTGRFVGTIKGEKSTEKVQNTTETREEFKVSAKADFDSATDLINRRNEIKKAITLSNATTKAQVGTLEMTVAEAIEMKSSIEYKKDFKRALEIQYSSAISNIERANEKVEANMDKILESMGKDANKEFIDNYRATYSFSIIDPISIKEKIESLAKEIEDFESNVDIALSVSNATTFIEIED